MTIESAAAYTIVCACEPFENINLRGNRESAFSAAGGLKLDKIRDIEVEMTRQVRRQLIAAVRRR